MLILEPAGVAAAAHRIGQQRATTSATTTTLLGSARAYRRINILSLSPSTLTNSFLLLSRGFIPLFLRHLLFC
jgi:hypothetical protein